MLPSLYIKQELSRAWETLEKEWGLKKTEVSLPPVLFPQRQEFGDFYTNWPLLLSSRASKNPSEIAKALSLYFKKGDLFSKIEVAGPGFLNFTLSDNFLIESIENLVLQDLDYFLGPLKKENSRHKVQVEFLSANPTGPLTAGNCRGGFAGDVLAGVYEKIGYQVVREYYLNDRGKQVERLGESIKWAIARLKGQDKPFPEDGYRGDYIFEIASLALEKGIDEKDLIEFALSTIIDRIKKTAQRMRIEYDVWFSERSLYEGDLPDKLLSYLEKKGLVYKKEGAIWFKSSKFGDDKDRVLLKKDKEPTYLFSDLLYHYEKLFIRRFDKVILLWGADHHGYVSRFLGTIEALGHKGKVEVLLYQLLRLTKGGQEVRMSKRKGEFITVDELLDEIGVDAARFHFLLHSLDTPMTLDLDLAKKKHKDNPVFYVQYAFARLQSILRKAGNSEFKKPLSLSHPQEVLLARKLVKYPEILVKIAENKQVHLLTFYAQELAETLHSFYEACPVLRAPSKQKNDRLALLQATSFVLKDLLEGVLKVRAPEKM